LITLSHLNPSSSIQEEELRVTYALLILIMLIKRRDFWMLLAIPLCLKTMILKEICSLDSILFVPLIAKRTQKDKCPETSFTKTILPFV